jgi:hypothetical protein
MSALMPTRTTKDSDKNDSNIFYLDNNYLDKNDSDKNELDKNYLDKNELDKNDLDKNDSDKNDSTFMIWTKMQVDIQENLRKCDRILSGRVARFFSIQMTPNDYKIYQNVHKL